MTKNERTAVYREDDNELYGYLAKDATGWQAQTIFGYTIARTVTRDDAEVILRERGLGYLTGIWQYYDKEDGDWFPCVISKAYEHKVTVIRTNELGFQSPEDYKMVTLDHPTEEKLVKAS